MGVEGQRQAILHAAIQALANRTCEQLTVEDILQAANVSRQTFYRCFANKTELFHRVFQDGNRMFLTALRSLDKSAGDPAQIAERALTGALLFVVHGGGSLRALYRQTVIPEGEFAPYREEIVDAMVVDVTEWARTGMGVSPDPMLVRAVLLAIEQLIFQMAGTRTPTPVEMETFRRTAMTLVNGTAQELRRQAAASTETPTR